MMQIEQIYTGCLAEAAYFVASAGEAAVIDPLRDPTPYLERAEKSGVKIKYICETHLHADFVSGHVELAERTGATIVYGPGADIDFDAHIARDNEVFSVGKLKIKVLHTPGHTLESVCYLLQDEHDEEVCLFTGDTLFIGDVGRPDLAVNIDVTAEDLAGKLYDSIQHKILPLPDHVLIYPAHGAGSACGKNISKDRSDTLAGQKLSNYALQPQSRQEFIGKLTEGLLAAPAYFAQNVQANREGATALATVLSEGLRELAANEFERLATSLRALVLDTRNASIFAKAHIPGSINIGLDGQFAPWVGNLIPDMNQAILLVNEEEMEAEAITRLARVGYDNTLGFLKGGIQAWQAAGKETDTIHRLSADELAIEKPQPVAVLDIRKATEYEAGHLEGVQNYPLDHINEWMHELDPQNNYVVHCAGGYRSMIAASILQARGLKKVADIDGGYAALKLLHP